MFSSVLIANRGEIAVRIARSARQLGLRTIAVYSDADVRAMHTRVCDEALSIGPSPARDSYLSIEKIIAAARKARAACIHPGYGFLSENAEFAEACAKTGIVFVGPAPEAMRAMGLKDRAKTLMAKSGVPIVPGFHGERQDAAFLKQKAYEIGYPVLIKAVAGGGGKGMRRVDKHAEFDAALEGAQREAQASFNDPRVLIEKYVASPRHIEIQVFGDTHGNIIHLNERDCSMQRRHQKVIEESPAPGMTKEVRATMGAAAVEAARAVGYVGAGTVEFIADGSKGLSPQGFWFMEMNTRLQVEHPVTEAVTGLDLVEWQFRVAAGEALPLRQNDVALNGHAIEARLYAEDPEHGFLPSTGKLVAFNVPDGVRLDTGFSTGSAVTPYYDAMIAKLIAHAPTREAAIDKLKSALDRSIVVGPRTNTAFLAALVASPGFRAGKFDTGYIDQNLAALGAAPHETDLISVASAVTHILDCTVARPEADEAAPPPSPWDATDGFQLSGIRSVDLPIIVEDQPMRATICYGHGGPTVSFGRKPVQLDPNAFVIEDSETIYVVRAGRQTRVTRASFDSAAEANSGSGVVRAPMHGKVLAVLVEKDAAVRKGERLAIIEAMKMEHTLLAPFDGRVSEIAAAVGSQIAEKATVMVIEPVE
ncbi:MAG: acetyl/propionyl/methylcrotonyl-CoA carboxylase subunit alpha [Xanthobacteraceae bacterium]